MIQLVPDSFHVTFYRCEIQLHESRINGFESQTMKLGSETQKRSFPAKLFPKWSFEVQKRSFSAKLPSKKRSLNFCALKYGAVSSKQLPRTGPQRLTLPQIQFSARGLKHQLHKARNPCACQSFCNPHEFLRLPGSLQRFEILAPATRNAF